MKRAPWGFVLAAAVIAMAGIPAYAGAAHLVAANEMKWTDVAEFPGLKMAVFEGDPAKGPSHFFIKFPAGFKADTHFHNADHYVAVVSGTIIMSYPGGVEKRLAAGSGFSFTGKQQHVTKCAEGAECVLFLDVRGSWDVIPVEKK